jgi:AcrR family transcriptional regulator
MSATDPLGPATGDQAAAGIRARVRAELTRTILETARRHLAEHGPSALSLRAVARDVGMVSSAVYRYVPSRDELLTMLIVDAYDRLGEAAEQAEASVERDDLLGRWRAVCHAVREWALAHPHEYSLIYGSPVPGYEAPQDTVGPATRIPALLVGLLRQAVDERRVPAELLGDAPPDVHACLGWLRQHSGLDLPDELFARGLMAWTHLFGAVSFELFGHRHDVIIDHDAFFAYEMDLTGRSVGIG